MYWSFGLNAGSLFIPFWFCLLSVKPTGRHLLLERYTFRSCNKKEEHFVIIWLKQSTWFVMIEYRIHSYCVLIFCCWYRLTTLSIGIEKICGLLHFLTRTPYVVCCLRKCTEILFKYMSLFRTPGYHLIKRYMFYTLYFFSFLVNYHIYLMNFCLCRIWTCLLPER
jgi:hypothetical protein